MQAQKRYSRYLPHAIIIAIFIVISCAFCYPAFQGKTMNQHDMFTWLYGSKESRDYHEQTGKNALWANNMFSGMPQALIDFYPETNWYNKLNHIIQFYTHGEVPNPATYFFLAMISFYILMCVLKVPRWLGAVGAVAFAFSSYNPIIISAGHTTKMLDIGFLPAIIAGVLWAYQGRYWAGAALAGLFLAFFFDSGHYQIIYYGSILVAVIIIAQGITALRTRQLKRWLYASCTLGLAALFALGANASRIIQVREYNPYSIRGGSSELATGETHQGNGLDRDYAFQWSNGIGETFCLLVPNLYGGASGEDIGADSHFGEKLASLNVNPQFIDQITASAPLYWGPQPGVSGPVYFGAIICLLTVLALLIIRNPFKWWLAGAALFFILLSMGKNFSAFNYFMFDHFPMLNKFRTPSMALAIPSILFPLLGIWALKVIFTGKISTDELLKKLKLSVWITGGLCLLILLATFMFMDYHGANDAAIAQQYGQALQNPQLGNELIAALRADRAAAAQKDTLRSLLFLLLAAAALWGFAKGKIKKEMAVAGLGLFICMDEIPVAHRYLNEHNFMDNDTYAMQFQPRPADIRIMQDKDLYYRVFDLSNQQNGPFNDPKPSYFHKSIGGYHGAKMEIYQELIENQISKYNSAVLNMLNTKYIIVPAGKNGEAVAQLNPEACGNAWFVSDIKWAASAEEAMKDLNAPSLQNPADTGMGTFRPLQTAILRDSLKPHFNNFTLGKDSSAYIKLIQYAPNKLKFESYNAQNGLAVFSDIYYPLGWKATIDGKESPIFRTDYVLRALQIPSGKHVIEFAFHPPAFEKGERIGLYGSILLTLLIIAGIWAGLRKKQGPPEEESASVALPEAKKKKGKQ